jgi:AcrR family transcriptional regulator
MNAPDVSEPHHRGGGRTPHGVAQHHALVLAAFHLIAEKGFEGLRTRDVAQRADLNIATLHYYFPSKEDLIRAVVAYMQERFANLHMPDTVWGQGGPLAEFRDDLKEIRFTWDMEPQLYLVLMELMLRAQRDPAIYPILQEMETHWQANITSYLARGVAEGVFRRDLDVTIAATALRIFVKGAVLEIMTHADQFPAERVYAEIERWLTAQAR